jgi:hypothetical protein
MIRSHVSLFLEVPLDLQLHFMLPLHNTLTLRTTAPTPTQFPVDYLQFLHRVTPAIVRATPPANPRQLEMGTEVDARDFADVTGAVLNLPSINSTLELMTSV